MAIKVNVVSGFDSRGLKQAQREIANFGKSISRVMDVAMAGLAAGSIAILATSVKAASNLEQQFGALDSVFKGNADQMKAFSKEAVNLGLSAADAAQNATLLGTMLKGSGMSLDEVTDKTKKLTVLASDLAATYGGTAVDAVTALTATFRGEFDPIEKYGVSLKKSDINARLAAEGNGKLTGSARKLAEAQAAINLIFQKTTDAQGQSAREADTFAGRMARVTAQFSNLQVEIGEQLMPYVIDLFDYLQSTDGQAEIQNLVEGFKQVATEVGKAIRFVIAHREALLKIAEGAVVIWGLSKAFAAVKIATDLVTVSMGILAGEMAITPIGAVVTLVGLLTAGLILLQPELQKSEDRMKGLNSEYDKLVKNAQKDVGKQLSTSSLGYGIGFTDLMSSKSRAAREQVAAKKLAEAGALAREMGQAANFQTEVVIPTIDPFAGLGGADTKATKKTAAQKAAEKKKADAKKFLADLIADVKKAANDLYQANLDAYNKQIDAIADLKISMKGLTSALKPMAFVTEDIGQFQQAAIDSFDEINKSITENSKMFKDGGASLLAYVASERSALQSIAKQRDELAKKYSLAKAVKEDVQGSIIAMGNLNGLLTAQTETVTETMTSVVNGISLVRTRTFEQTKSTGDIVSGFKAILDKAKTFAKSLTELKKLGLNGTLFKQIVDSGAEAGTATADAIIAGGADAVTSLNDTFAELEKVGASVGEQTAVVMYGAGVDLTNGLLEGIKSQEQVLMETATAMAEAFASAFNTKILATIQMPTMPSAPDLSTVGTTVSKAITTRPDPTRSPQSYAAWLASVGGIDPIRSPQSYAAAQAATYNVTVNAGVIASKQELPQIIVDALGTYTKQSGAGGLTRVLGI